MVQWIRAGTVWNCHEVFDDRSDLWRLQAVPLRGELGEEVFHSYTAAVKG
jgi:hypothetical protein